MQLSEIYERVATLIGYARVRGEGSRTHMAVRNTDHPILQDIHV
jgi:hypothetical protein